MGLPVSKEEAKRLLREMLADPELRSLIEEELSATFAPKQATEDHLQKLYQELVSLRKESERKWEIYVANLQRLREESERKWQQTTAELQRLREESEKRWQESQKRWEELSLKLEEYSRRLDEYSRRLDEHSRRLEQNQRHLEFLYQKTQELDKRYNTSITAIGARCGYRAEAAFRNSLKAILEEDFGVRVERYLRMDEEGKVFGRPAPIEMDLIIYNGKTILAEIRSSIDEEHVYAFLNKIAFYEGKEGRKVTRSMIISPMVHLKALKLAKAHGVEVHYYPSARQFRGKKE